MKRDRDLIRNLLLKIEASDTPDGLNFESRFGPIADDMFLSLYGKELHPEMRSRDYHLIQMQNSGLIEFVDPQQGDDFRGGRVRLTPAGHDAVDVVSDNSFWAKLRDAGPKEAYEIIKSTGSSVAASGLTKLMGWG